MSNEDELRAAAQAWNNAEPHAPTRALGQLIIDGGEQDIIREHYGMRLAFGTAGLRGEMGPGPNRMNHATVRRAAYAFAQHLMSELPVVSERGIVIGFDARHGSREFAEETAQVFGALGLPSYLYDEHQPTPVVAHAIKFLRACGGVIVTASHNPPKDNGYKVYWSNGAQIVSPHDAGISQYIDQVQQVSDIAIEDLESLRQTELVRPVPTEVREHYFREILAERVGVAGAPIKVVYTAMHGVGYKTMQTALNMANYHDIYPVADQVEPDPDFPTVVFPNPEEEGAMDLALQTAKDIDADVILANDPDADRLCVGIKDSGEYRLLTGNEVGIIIGDELLRKKCAGNQDLVATTIVSSQLLGKLAIQYGADYRETLTGFKWLANSAIEKEASGGRFLFGFEEALGYSVGPVVRDKDGISVALVLCDLLSELKDQDKTLLDRLLEIYRSHGVHASAQHSIKLPGASGRQQIEAMMSKMRAHAPVAVNALAVVKRIDYQEKTRWENGTDSAYEDAMPSSNVLGFYLEDGTRILARPSGTEPKIKFYFESVVHLGPSDSLQQGESMAKQHLNAIMTAFLGMVNPS